MPLSGSDSPIGFLECMDEDGDMWYVVCGMWYVLCFDYADIVMERMGWAK